MNIYRYIIFLLLACFVAACSSNDDPSSIPYYVFITGPTSVTPETTETYAFGDYASPETFIWTVEGPAEIVGTNQGDTITIKFLSAGAVKLTIKNETHFRVVNITVEEPDPTPEISFGGTGFLKNASKDTVFISFPSALETTPMIKKLVSTDTSYFNAPDLAFNSGTLGSLVKIDEKNYYAIYTADQGNGQPEALITGIKSTETYGSVELDSAYIQLPTVDNIAPISNLTYSTLSGNDSTVVVITATFSEPVKFKNPLNKALLISFSGAGVKAETDSLKPTSNPLVYTYMYTINGNGNGTIDVALSNITDLGGNDLATFTNGNILRVDNVNPVVTGLASDGGDFVSLQITSSETGTASYLILDSTEEAPTTVEEFLDNKGISGSTHVSEFSAVTIVNLLSTGSYKIYFLAKDEVGNYSSLVMAPLVMD